MHTRWTISAFAAMAAVGLPAFAATIQMHADFDGLQEVPPDASPAYGAADITLNDVTGAFTVTAGTFQDLLGGSTFIHLRGPAAPGVNGVLIMALTLDTPGAATGTFSGGGVLAAGNIADMLADKTYLNLGSTVFPASGEIRGQLFKVPEPASLILLSAGGALLLRGRARRA